MYRLIMVLFIAPDYGVTQSEYTLYFAHLVQWLFRLSFHSSNDITLMLPNSFSHIKIVSVPTTFVHYSKPPKCSLCDLKSSSRPAVALGFGIVICMEQFDSWIRCYWWSECFDWRVYLRVCQSKEVDGWCQSNVILRISPPSIWSSLKALLWGRLCAF